MRRRAVGKSRVRGQDEAAKPTLFSANCLRMKWDTASQTFTISEKQGKETSYCKPAFSSSTVLVANGASVYVPRPSLSLPTRNCSSSGLRCCLFLRHLLSGSPSSWRCMSVGHMRRPLHRMGALLASISLRASSTRQQELSHAGTLLPSAFGSFLQGSSSRSQRQPHQSSTSHCLLKASQPSEGRSRRTGLLSRTWCDVTDSPAVASSRVTTGAAACPVRELPPQGDCCTLEIRAEQCAGCEGHCRVLAPGLAPGAGKEAATSLSTVQDFSLG